MPGAPRTAERLHKHLAHLGVESRRTVERWIEQGKVRVNGRVAQLGDKVDANSRITVDGRPLRWKPAAPPQRVIVYNKPEGQINTRKDPQNRPTVFQHLPKLKGGRWVAVGRLDINSRGLLLFTNDGGLANRLMHPRFCIEREYLCRVYGPVDAAAIARLRQGVRRGRESFRFQQVRRMRGAGGGAAGRNAWYSVVVSEGRYREVRRAWEAVGGRVSRLIRVRYGSVTLPKTLRSGQWRELKPAAISKLLQSGRAVDAEPPPGGAS
ncbi:MAG: pseudouridine synthase [Gammaproteobacteria bacterium]|nr:pseudouridine synthase [Gammaproteobacteria bacterium]